MLRATSRFVAERKKLGSGRGASGDRENESATGIRATMAGNELEEALRRFRKLPKPVRVVYARPRTFVAIALGIVAFFLLPSSLRLVTRLLDRLGRVRRALSRARLHHDVAQRAPQREAQRRACRTTAAS